MRHPRSLATLVSALLLCTFAMAQHDHSAMGHDSGMSESMPHKLTDRAKLQVTNLADPAKNGGVLVVRVGPVELPANASHMDVAQMPDFFLDFPFSGWITGYSPRLVDAQGNQLPSRMLHHVAVWNSQRTDFLCANKEEHIFGAGGEMNQWPVLPGIGYWTRLHDRIRINTMFHNPTPDTYPAAYLEFRVFYRLKVKDVPDLKNVYPAWFDVGECGHSGYDLPAGESSKSGEFTLQHSGKLIGLGGHLHDHGLAVTVDAGGQRVANLPAKLDDAGNMIGMPIVNFMDKGGLPLAKDEVVKVTANYNNPTGKTLTEGAMGIAVGYFLPNDDKEMAAHRRKAKSELKSADQ
jgi:hypothetical protein